jgi:adenylate cyclase
MGTRVRALAAVGVVAVAVALGLAATGVLAPLENWTVAKRFEVRGAEPARDVAVVAIDDADLARLGRWPLPRSRHAAALDALRRAGVRAIAYDVQFTEPSADPREDAALYDAVGRARGTVLATTAVHADGSTDVLGGEQSLRPIGARAANALLPAVDGGVLRSVPSKVDGLTSFAVAAAEAATHRRLDGDALIDFHGPPGTVPTYSFAELVRGRVPARALRGRVVVVGASAPSLQDLHRTPTSGDGEMAGPEIQANAISTVLRGLPLRPAPGWLDALLGVALAVIVPLVALRLRALWAALLGAGAVVALLVGAQLAFDAGVVLSVAPPLAGLAVGAVGTLAAAAAVSAAARRKAKALFGRFVPAPVVEQLLEREGGEARLGGVRRDSTVLFCDLRGFTSFAEDAEPELVIEVMNRYLSEMSDGLLAHGGTVVSYLGDGIMAVFGSPVPRDDHASAAVLAACELAGERLAALNAWLQARGLAPFALGVGVNSGPVMSGLVGSQRRMEYAAVGDTTNVAARLQAATKGSEHAVYVSESAFERLDAVTAARLVSAGELHMAGRERAVRVFAPRPVAASVSRAA